MTRSFSQNCTPNGGQILDAARVFGILSEPTRLRILDLLRDGPATVTEIVERTGLRQANTSKQLSILHHSGILARERDGNLVRYRIRLPLVLQLCTAVCGCLREQAVAKARSLQDSGTPTPQLH